jgi:acyl-CoA synthetase (AMP-forming)/AMP-acid ligase II
VLVSTPPYHVAGVMNLLTNLYFGRRIVYLDAFDPTRWLETARKETVTHAMLVPTMLARIIAALDGADPALPSLRSLSYGGARMPKPVIEEALRAFPSVAFTNAYGLTETSSTITLLGPDDHRDTFASLDPSIRARLHSAGRPLPGIEVEVRSPHGERAVVGEIGAIFVRGEQVAGEYLGSTASTSEWFATRDNGYFDADGYLYIEGRADDTIIRGGENIAPAEIEDVLLHHDGVADCAVVGVDDDEWGQRIAAAVVLAPNCAATAEELREFAKQHLRTSKTPDVVVLLDALPYTDTGKLVRRAVREQLAAVTAHANGAK